MRKILSQDGSTVGLVDAAGRVTLGLEPGAPVGLARSSGDVFGDEAGARLMAHVDGSGQISDESHERLGTVDAAGMVRDKTGRIVGKVGEPVDAAVLLLILGAQLPAKVVPAAQAEGARTLMDEALDLNEEQTCSPGIKRSYKPLTDEDVYGKPKRAF